MRYEDASGAFQASGPVANDDSDTLAAGSRGPATGNLISGEGTQYGSAGADTAAGAQVTAIAGKGGEDSSFAAGKLSVAGEFGQLSVDAEGNYTYLANKGAPENVRDRFTYTLADNQGNSDTAALIVEIGKTPVVIKADAQQIVPGPDGVVTLPPGVELSDIMVVGRNLVINMPDGTQLIIVDGAIFVPQLVLGGVEIPATNVAALLIGQEPQPAAGETPPSSGGNFALPPPPLDPGVPLGDLIPPTEYNYTPPEPQETFLPEDNEPEIFVQPDGQPASVNAVDQVEEAGLPERDGDLLDEPAGSGESADGNGTDNDVNSETTTGNIVYDSPDTPNVITINGIEIVSVGQVIHGAFGDLTITSIAPGVIGYSYTLLDNTSGNDTHDDFAVQLVDVDGDIASATLRIDIIDDVPTARPDTDTVGDGEDPMVATGNVMTDAAPGDAGDSDTNAADTVGADDARVTFIDSVDAAPGANVPDGGFVDIAGQYGMLRIFSNGDYEYTRGQDAPGGVQDVFNYTLTDGDGDTSVTTLTINIPDQFPDLPNPDAVLLDDDALANGNPGGTGDDVDSQGTPGQLVGSGGDGDLDYNFTGVNTLPAGFTTNLVNAGTLQILQGGTIVLTVTLDNETGAFSVVQNNPIDHVAGGNENNYDFSIGVEVEDSDGDVEPASISINVDDDTPELNEVVASGDVTLDESDAGSPAGFPISDNSVVPVIDFNALFGADGPAAVNSVEYGIVITGGPGSGLQTAVGDFAITLVQIDGDTIEGHFNGSNVAFIIQMEADGTVTLTQNVPLEHLDDGGPGPAHNDALDLGGLIAATVTITDGDGDEASAQAGIGDNLVFLDDGPDAQVDEEATLDTLVLDETTPPGTETDGDSNPAGLVSVQANFADNFVAPVDHGADGPGTVSYAFVLGGDDVPSGLYAVDPTDTDAGDGDGYGQGDEIVLNQSGNTITGSVGLVDYFTITINPATGVVTFTQLDNIWHANTGNDDDTSTLMADLGSLLVQQTVTDSDGDFDTASVDVSQGVFQIEDDGPVATNDVDEILAGGETAQGNVITGSGTNGGIANADDVGADSPGRVSAVSSVNEPGNTDQDPDPEVFEIDGEFGTLVLNADGSYTYTRFDGAPGSAEDVFTYTLIDADGDTDQATLTITIEDSTPNLPDPGLVRLDDDVIPGENGNVPDGPGDDDPDVVGENVVNGQLNGSGGDGDLDYFFTGTNTLPAGFSVNAAGLPGSIQILQGATVVMTITLNNETGAFTVTQNNPIVHPTLNGDAGDDTENNLLFSIGVEVEDSDGDTEGATITINVDDDTPVLQNVTAGAGVDVDESDYPFPVSDTSDDPVIDADMLFGADGPAAVNSIVYGLSIVGGSPEPSGLQTAVGNHDITLVQLDSDTIQGQYQDGGTQVAFIIQMNADGTVTLTQNVPLEHLDDGPPGPDHDDTLDLDGLINATVTITDFDGDSTSGSAPIGDNLVFFDDGPDAAVDQEATLDELVLDETRPIGEDSDSGDDDPGGLATVQANFADNFESPVDYGADGAGTTTYAFVLDGDDVPSGLYALDNTDTDAGDGDGYGQGAEIVLNQSGNTITGSVGLVDYFTITINPATGVVTFTQLANVWHADSGDDDDTSSLMAEVGALLVQQTVTDSDGDFDTASVDVSQGVFHIEDDGPEILAVDNLLQVLNDANPSNTGDFDFDIGTDSPNGDNDDISVSNFAVSVNGIALDPADFELVEGAEDASTANYTFSFEYSTGAGGTATATGTLVFDKVAGTYTVTLTSGPIEGFSILQTSAGTLFQGYEFGTSNLDGSQPEISVTQIQGTPGDPDPSDLFVQFTSVSEPSSGTGDDALEVTSWVPGADNPPPVDGGGDTSWSAGQLFNQDDGWVSTSNDANGVDGDTIQGGEVIDFTLVQGANPTGVLAQPATFGQASSMFLKFDGIGTGEDMIVILKLYDPILETYTTKAVMITNSDIFKGPADNDPNTPAPSLPAPYQDITLDNNDGFVVIESNDYNLPGENWVIVGAQIAGSDEGVTGTAINLNSAVGAGGDSDADNNGSLDTQAFSTDTNDGPFKISSIGFVTESTQDQTAELTFDVTVTDVDGDSQTESITVDIGDTQSALLAPAETTMSLASEPAGDGSISNLSFSNDNGKVNGHGNDKGFSSINNTGIVAGIVAAAGLQSAAAATSPSIESSFDVGLQDMMQTVGLPAYQLQSIDDGSLNSQSFGLAGSEPALDFGALQGSGHGFNDFVENGGLDVQSYGDAVPAYEPSFAVDQAPAIDASMLVATVAPAVGMPSAEALIAAGLVGGIQQGGSVEQILADALGSGAPTVDSLLDAVNGGNSPAVDAALNALQGGGGAGDLSAVLNGTSPDFGAVSSWDMSMPGSSGAGFDMMFKMDVANLHQDAVQPTVNG